MVTAGVEPCAPVDSNSSVSIVRILLSLLIFWSILVVVVVYSQMILVLIFLIRRFDFLSFYQ